MIRSGVHLPYPGRDPMRRNLMRRDLMRRDLMRRDLMRRDLMRMEKKGPADSGNPKLWYLF